MVDLRSRRKLQWNRRCKISTSPKLSIRNRTTDWRIEETIEAEGGEETGKETEEEKGMTEAEGEMSVGIEIIEMKGIEITEDMGTEMIEDDRKDMDIIIEQAATDRMPAGTTGDHRIEEIDDQTDQRVIMHSMITLETTTIIPLVQPRAETTIDSDRTNIVMLTESKRRSTLPYTIVPMIKSITVGDNRTTNGKLIS